MQVDHVGGVSGESDLDGDVIQETA